MAERVAVPRFVGGTGRLAINQPSQTSRERTINRVVQSTQGFGGKVEKRLRGRPGLTAFASIAGQIDTSALQYQDGVAFCCTGTSFSQIFDDGGTVPIGTITYNASFKATMVAAGSVSSGDGSTQVMIVSSAGDVYVYDTATAVFTNIPFIDPVSGNPFPVAMCEFMDGYFLAQRLNSRRVYYSALEDATTWDFTFGYFERSWGGDNISFIKRSGRQLWVVGTKTSEVWADSGNQNDPFAPIQGALLDIGCIAKYTGQRDGETITWVNLSEHGGGLVVRANGYQPQEVSTYPISLMLQQVDTIGFLSLCEAYVHQTEGHRFYQLHVPIIDTTPVLDFSESEWVEWAMWNTAQAIWEAHIGRCQAYAFERQLIGVRNSGIIYEQSFNVYSDGIVP
jgi:hypothetical protein